jgi:hypothetical protein
MRSCLSILRWSTHQGESFSHENKSKTYGLQRSRFCSRCLHRAAITISPASVQAADVQAQIDSLGVAPQRLTPDATSGRTLRSYARRGAKGWIALHRPDRELVYIKLDQIVFVMSAKDTGAAERPRSMVQLLNGHSDVRESVEEVMQIIENDGLLAKDDT